LVESFHSQWGLIPKNPLTGSRGSFRAVRIGNTNKKMVEDPTVNNFLPELTLVNNATLTGYPALQGGEVHFSKP
jgi:hypothetical protein